MRNIFLLIIILELCSCRWFTDAAFPFIKNAQFKVPPGSPAFQAGFTDGCNQIFYSRGNSLYRAMHRYHYDTKMSGNTEYRFGYKRGISYCFNTVITGVAGPVGSFDKYLFPYQDDDGFVSGGIKATNYNTAGGGLFDGLKAPLEAERTLDSQYNVWGGGGGQGSVFTANPLWAGGSANQFFGQ